MTLLSFPLRSAFLALPLENEAQERFRHIQERLEPFSDLFRFQAADRPHLTLIYWPSLMEIEYVQLLRQAEKIALRTAPFTLEVAGAGTFEGEKLPKVLFLTVARSAGLADLKKRCPWPNICHAERSAATHFDTHFDKLSAAQHDVAARSRSTEAKPRFHPHITIARMKNPNAFRVHEKKIRKLLKDVAFTVPCDRLRLYAEIDHVKQAAIHDFPFGGAREVI